MSKYHENVYRVFNYTEHLLILISTVTGRISISAFAPLTGIPLGITSSAVGLKICAIAIATKNYKSIITKNKKTCDKLVLLAKTKLNTIESLNF